MSVQAVQAVPALAPTFCCGCRPAGASRMGYDGANQSLDSPRPLDLLPRICLIADSVSLHLHMRTSPSNLLALPCLSARRCRPSAVESCPRLVVDPKASGPVGHFMCITWVKVATTLGCDRVSQYHRVSTARDRAASSLCLCVSLCPLPNSFSCGLPGPPRPGT